MGMLVHPSFQIIGYTGIENGMCDIGENIDKVIFMHAGY